MSDINVKIILQLQLISARFPQRDRKKNVLPRSYMLLVLPVFLSFTSPMLGQQEVHSTIISQLVHQLHQQNYDYVLTTVDSLLTTNPPPAFEADLQNQKGNALREMGKLEEALRIHQSVLATRRAIFGTESIEAANSLNNLGNTYLNLGNIATAKVLLTECAKIRDRQLPPNDTARAAVAISLGYVAQFENEYEQAANYFQEALRIKQQAFGQKSPKTIASRMNLGQFFFARQRFDDALLQYQQALQIQLDSIGKTNGNAALLHSSIGNCLLQQQQLEAAQKWLTEAVTIIENPAVQSSTENQSICYQNLGNYFLFISDYKNAEIYLQKALATHQTNNLTRFKIRNNIGLCYKNMQDWETANSLFNTLNNDYPTEDEFKAGIYENLGSVLFGKGWYGGAAYHYQKAVALYDQLSVHPSRRANAIGKWSDCLLAQNELAAAEQQLKRLLQTNSNDSTTNALTHFRLGNLFLKKDQPAAALDAFQSALQLVQGQHQLDLEANILIRLGKTQFRVAATQPALLEALATLQRAERLVQVLGNRINEATSTLYFNDYFSDLYDQLVAVCFELGNHDDNFYIQAFEYAERNKAEVLENMLQKQFARRTTDAASQLREKQLLEQLQSAETALYEQTQFAYQASDTLKVLYDKIYSLRKSLRLLQDSMNSNSSFKADTLTAQGIASMLSKEQSLVAYHLGQEKIYAFVFDAAEMKSFVLQRPDSLTVKISTFYNSIRRRPDLLPDADAVFRRYCQLAYEFYQLLVAPIEAHLAAEVIIIPDKILHYLPFETFLEEPPRANYQFGKHAYLLKKYHISYAYSYQLWQLMQARKVDATARPLLAVAPSFMGRDTLHFNVAEAQALKRLLGGKIITGFEAVKASFQQELSKPNRIVHFSTHGIANSNQAAYSYLSFAHPTDRNQSDQLYVAEIYNLPIAADLVFLSACQTNLGRYFSGEGVISLTRAFTYAGAKSIISSLWSIDDEQTNNIVQKTYQNFAKGLPKNRALSTAKRDYLAAAKQLEQHPYYWSALILVGDEGQLTGNINANKKIRWLLLGLAVGILLLTGGVRYFKMK